MATKLSVINNLLTRMREPRVTSSTSSPYATVLAAIVAEAYEEVLDEWNWRQVAKASYIEVPAGAGSVFPTTDTVKYGPIPDGRIAAVREYGEPFALSYRGILTTDIDGNPTNEAEFFTEAGVGMGEMTLPTLYREVRGKLGVPTSSFQELPPSSFALRPLSDESLEIYFEAPCASDWTFSLAFYERPARLDATTDTDNVPFAIPFRPVQELALMYALNERGEEMGEPGNLAQGRYVQALTTAKEIDIKAGEHSNRYDWGRD